MRAQVQGARVGVTTGNVALTTMSGADHTKSTHATEHLKETEAERRVGPMRMTGTMVCTKSTAQYLLFRLLAKVASNKNIHQPMWLRTDLLT